ncbi:hypothetical protein FRC14_004801 [Serendipita sp. 396]|nr:hypothetical protein FRC14_004801 [Serendipita sp. 396]KAG8789319.1 hypothetical protein FRC15_009371 [Serendipita sp. 397]KAG8804554.1 hypothetical protein FRC16_005996 [Serendipita sp. 398]KAG8878673.1 hypothetical protein FRC20_006350 [Serendipita sp. 405]
MASLFVITLFSTKKAPELSSEYLLVRCGLFILVSSTTPIAVDVHARYTGTGHADLTKWEWATHQHRDTLSSVVGHPALTSYLAIADGESIGRIKFEMAEKMLQPCGPPPAKTD